MNILLMLKNEKNVTANNFQVQIGSKPKLRMVMMVAPPKNMWQWPAYKEQCIVTFLCSELPYLGAFTIHHCS